ncbi:MAG: hypothetical protein ACRD8Z_05760 [Nitrososphaeraceae archaeon]
MTLEEIRKRNAERKQIMQSRSAGRFLKFVNDQDTMVIKIVAPFEGFDREVKDMQGKKRLKPHYRAHNLGDWNYDTGQAITRPRIEPTANDVRALKIEDAKIWSTPQSAVQGIQREVDKGHSILQVRRDGQAKSTSTTYNVLNALQMDEQDIHNLLPKLTKEDLTNLQAEEKFNEISDEEIEALQNLGNDKED